MDMVENGQGCALLKKAPLDLDDMAFSHSNIIGGRIYDNLNRTSHLYIGTGSQIQPQIPHFGLRETYIATTLHFNGH